MTHTLTGTPEAAPGIWAAREWLLTNGQGSYAMGTALGANTRRYHGLLVAAAHPPVDRILALANTIDTLTFGQEAPLPLSTFMFPGASAIDPLFHPQGHRTLTGFTRDLTVAWIHTVGDFTLTRELVLHPHAPAITLRYTLTSPRAPDRPALVQVAPLMALRSFHALVGHLDPADLAHQYTLDHEPGSSHFTVHHDGQALTLHFPQGRFTPGPDPWHDFLYCLDARRGQSDREDLATAGTITFGEESRKEQGAEGEACHDQTPGTSRPASGDFSQTFTLTAALGPTPVDPLERPQARADRLAPMADRLPVPQATRRAMAIAADDFVIVPENQPSKVKGPGRSRPRPTVVAGYPWFADWGRDTFIALPGLLRVTGRSAHARAIFAAYARHMKRGLIPNHFDDRDPDAAAYNTVDASLWYIHAALDHHQHNHTKADRDFWQSTLAPACAEIIQAYQKGVSPPGAPTPEASSPLIHMDSGALIVAGNEHTNLTWMDGAIGDHAFTPRMGKAVEINALWHHALVGLAQWLPEALGEVRRRCADLAPRAAASFNDIFWDDARGYCHDCVAEGLVDRTLRPNMIFAASLPSSPLSMDQRAKILSVVGDKLLTPLGLRTLPTDDPNYHGTYLGDQPTRDEAYHQGTIWPWLIGPYAEAVLRVGGFSQDASEQARAAMMPLMRSLTQGEGAGAQGPEPACLGQLSEIHQADDLAPRGCPAQAWSVGELLRAWDLLAGGG